MSAHYVICLYMYGKGFVCCIFYSAIYMPSSAEERGKQPDWADVSRAMFKDMLDTNKDGL